MNCNKNKTKNIFRVDSMQTYVNLDESSPRRKKKRMKKDKTKVCEKILKIVEMNNCLDETHYTNPERSYRVMQSSHINTYRPEKPEEREK